MEVPLPVSKGPVSLQLCIDAFSQPEQMEVRCEKCAKDTPSTKTELMAEIGDYVFLDIHRVNPATGRTKSKTEVLFPREPVTLISDSDERYEAVAVLEHVGYTMHAGHWRCCKKLGDEWWLFDDSEVSLMDKRQIDASRRACLVLLKKVGKQ